MERQVEKLFPFPTTQRFVSVLDWEWMQAVQADMLVVGCPKQVAAASGLHLDTIYRARQGRPMSFLTTMRISHAQNNYDYVAFVLRKCGQMLATLRRLSPSVANQQLAALLMDRVGVLLRFCSKYESSTVLSEQEVQVVETVGTELKQVIDEIIARIRQGSEKTIDHKKEDAHD